MKKGRLFVISAPSGAGKTTLVNALLQDQPVGCPVQRVITYTTRALRAGEINNSAYHFVTRETFEEKIRAGFFLEWSSWYDDYYGSARCVLDELDGGKSFIMILDRSGARSVKQVYPQAELIWIQPPSLEVLQDRLEKRGDTLASRRFRLERASLELEQEKKEHLYDHVIINDSFDKAVQELKLLVCP